MTKIVLLPGSDGTCILFSPLIECMKLDCFSIAYPPDQVLDYEQLANLIRPQLPLDEPYVLLGESFSGPIAIDLAASNPPGLVGLILCASFAKSPYPLLRHIAPIVQFLPVNLPLWFFSTMLMGHYATPELKQMLGSALRLLSPQVLRGRIRSILTIDYLWKVGQIKVPTLYIRAKHDRVVPRSAGDAFMKVIPNGEMVEIEAPHFVLQCCPEDAAMVINQYF